MDKEVSQPDKDNIPFETNPKFLGNKLREQVSKKRSKLKKARLSSRNKNTRLNLIPETPNLFTGLCPLFSNNIPLPESSTHLSKKLLLDFSIKPENILSVLALYRGSTTLGEISTSFQRTNEIILALSPDRLFHFISGIGIITMPRVYNFHNLFGIKENFNISLPKFKKDSIESFISQTIIISNNLPSPNFDFNISPKNMKLILNESDKLGYSNSLISRILTYSNPFFQTNRHPKAKDPMAYRTYLMKTKPIYFQRSSPGDAYIQRTIKFLKSRGCLSD